MKKLIFGVAFIGLFFILYENGMLFEAARAFVEIHLVTFVVFLVGILAIAFVIFILYRSLVKAIDTENRKKKNAMAVGSVLAETLVNLNGRKKEPKRLVHFNSNKYYL